MAGVEIVGGLSDAGAGIFDRLSLVEHDVVKAMELQSFSIAQQGREGGDDQVAVLEHLVVAMATWTAENQHRQ